MIRMKEGPKGWNLRPVTAKKKGRVHDYIVLNEKRRAGREYDRNRRRSLGYWYRDCALMFRAIDLRSGTSIPNETYL